MNKFNFMFGAVALVAGVALSSCASDDDTVVVKEVKVQVGKTLTVKSNVEATFTFDGQTKTGTQVEFATKAVEGVLTVSAEGYISQQSNVSFGESNMVSLDITLMEKASNEVAQESAKGTTVYSDANNWGLVAGIEVPSDVAINGSDKSFSVATFQETNVIDANKLETGDEVRGSVVSFDLQPMGATFSRPVKLTAAMPAGVSSDFEFEATNGTETVPVQVKDGVLSAEVDNFSLIPWQFRLIARIIRIEVGRDIQSTYVVPVRPGTNPAISPIHVPFGWEPVNVHTIDRFINGAFRLVGNFLRSLFGAPTQTKVTDQYTFEITGVGTLTYHFEIPYKIFTFVFNNQRIPVKVYTGLAIPVIDSFTPTHSGGSSFGD